MRRIGDVSCNITKCKNPKQEHFDEECMFKEGIFENYWTTYSALKWGFDKINQIPGTPN